MKKDCKHTPDTKEQTPGVQTDFYSEATKGAVKQEVKSLNSLGAQENQSAGPDTIIK